MKKNLIQELLSQIRRLFKDRKREPSESLDPLLALALVCKEMGLIDEAIKQFQMALEKGQKPMEASKLLNQCLGNKRPLEECRSFKEMLRQQSA